MQFKEQKHGDVTVVSVKGKMMGGNPIAIKELQALFQKVRELAEMKQGAKIIVDISKVKWMNSSGLGTLIGSLTATKNAGSHLKLAGITEKVQSLLMIAILITIFETYDTTDAAIESFK